MAVRTLPGSPAWAAALPTAGTLLLLAALPFVFLHVDFQPSLAVWRAELALSDFAVLAVGAGALAVAVRRGIGRLRSGLPVWVAAAVFLVLALASCFYPLLSERTYDWQTHLVSVGKYAEYALLALAVPLLARSRRDLHALLVGLVAWSALATAVGLAQFAGAGLFDAWPAGRRQPSFLGHHDFAALSGASGAVALAALALPRWRPPARLSLAAGLAGGLGLILSGSSAAAIGFGAAAVAAILAGRLRGGTTLRRAGAIAAVAAVVGGGVVVLRGGDIDEFLRYVGLREKQEQSGGVETYVHRTLLVYLGVRIFRDHPVLGVGWHGSAEESGYGPYLDDAHRRFPDAPPLAFPSSENPYGVQNAYVQALADLGVVGLLALLGLLGAGLAVAVRAVLGERPEPAALIGALALLVVMGIWTAVGLVAGLPLDGLLWLALGLAVWRE